MQVEFLGTAGYHPNLERHTSCTFVPDASADHAFVLDAGTGFFRLMNRQLPKNLHIFLSHAHLDHVSGLTYLHNLLYNRETTVTLYATRETLEVVRHSLFDSPLFPLPLRCPTREIVPGEPFEADGARVNTFMLTHPGGSLAYRFDWPDRSLAYVTDTAGDGKYIDFISGVDLLIHERNFSDDLHEIADASGHCTSEAVVRVAKAAQVRQLALTHFNPLTENEPLEEDALTAQLPGVISARDGLVVEF